MISRSFLKRAAPRRKIEHMYRTSLLALVACVIFASKQACAANAPQWMRAVVNASVPGHDDKTNAVLMYEETDVNVISLNKIKIVVRRAYKILRPDGREYGTVLVPFTTPDQKVNAMRGWCIPAQGRDYEVTDKEAIEIAYPKVDGSELISDLRVKALQIPAADTGNLIGYEYELEEQPYVLEDEWLFQSKVPSRESHYSLQLPQGWEYKATWLNYPQVEAVSSGNNQWRWTVADVKGIREETDMPPMRGVAGQLVIAFFPVGGMPEKVFTNWLEMGKWYWALESGRLIPSDGIKQKTASLTASAKDPVDKMRNLAAFVQHDIRYVSIQLGIGGWQPHPASDIFTHHYGDCKDKTNLFRVMLKEIGIQSYRVAIFTERGAITSETPAYRGFNHEITAIKLPDGTSDSSLIATVTNPKLGKILFFDPTDELTPFGQIGGNLQANFGLVVMREGGELIELPKQPSAMNSIRRTAKMTLDATGRLQADVEEVRLGDRAWSQRWALRNVSQDSERIRPIERLLAEAFSNFRITKASVTNLQHSDQPFGWKYSFEVDNYAKNAGGLFLVRPRVLGSKGSVIMETKETRLFPIEFDAPIQDTDSFEIALPAGYTIDDLPPPVDVDFGFASYHSKTELKGNVLGYTRTFEVKELNVPVSKAEELKKFYRIIAADERSTAVLKASK